MVSNSQMEKGGHREMWHSQTACKNQRPFAHPDRVLGVLDLQTVLLAKLTLQNKTAKMGYSVQEDIGPQR